MFDKCFLYYDYQCKFDEGVYSGYVAIHHSNDNYVGKLSLF